MTECFHTVAVPGAPRLVGDDKPVFSSARTSLVVRTFARRRDFGERWQRQQTLAHCMHHAHDTTDKNIKGTEYQTDLSQTNYRKFCRAVSELSAASAIPNVHVLFTSRGRHFTSAILRSLNDRVVDVNECTGQ